MSILDPSPQTVAARAAYEALRERVPDLKAVSITNTHPVHDGHLHIHVQVADQTSLAAAARALDADINSFGESHYPLDPATQCRDEWMWWRIRYLTVDPDGTPLTVWLMETSGHPEVLAIARMRNSPAICSRTSDNQKSQTC